MNDRLFERVRAALASTIRIDSEIGRGGMGVVYGGLHRQLDVRVAVKVMQPRHTGTEVEERFLREAQLMARFRHPHIIKVLDRPAPEQVDQLNLFVMDFVDGESLAEKREQGRIPPAKAFVLGKQVLEALTEVHRNGVLHLDVKPENVIYDKIRRGWILTDFGIAKVLDNTSLSDPGVARGTPGFMPPDEEEWRSPTYQRDLYSTAATIYEAYTSEPWNSNTSPTSTEWRRIPALQARALRKGSAPVAKDRWRTAEEFRREFGKVPLPPAIKVAIGVVSLLLLGAIGLKVWDGTHPVTSPPPIELVTAGVTTNDPTLQAKASDLTAIMNAGLNATLQPDPILAPKCTDEVRVRHCVAGELGKLPGDSLNVTLVILGGGGREVVTLAGAQGDVSSLGGRLAVEVLSRTGHAKVIEECLLPSSPTTTQFKACDEYHQGVDAFRRGDWTAAPAAFRQAIDLNPALVDALWRLYTTDVWRREDPDSTVVRIIIEHRSELPLVHRMLFDAQRTPQGGQRNVLFQRVIQRFPDDPFVYLLYGSELFHRGALSGIPLDSSAAILQRAVEKDTAFSEAYDQLIWVLIRLGRRAAAESALAKYPPQEKGALYEALVVAHDVRFDPQTAIGKLMGLTRADTTLQRFLRQTFRFGLSLDIPAGEAVLGQAYLGAADPGTRADGREGFAIANLAEGKIRVGIAQVDSAGMGELSALEAAEWRVIPAALGVFALDDGERERGRSALRSIARSQGSNGARAAWALTVEALLKGDAKTASTWEAILASQSARDTVPRLRALLAAVRAGSTGRWKEGVMRSEALTSNDESPQVPDPFFRSVLHMLRGRWFLALGDSIGAEREWLWVYNADLEGWSTGPAQAAEVDGVVGTYTRTIRARLAAPRCLDVARVDTITAESDRDLFPIADTARALAQACRP